MSVKIHPREQGATLECNNCAAKYTTGQVRAKGIRAGAKGWIRGLWSPGTKERAPNKRDDICPACAPAEKKAATDRKAAADLKRTQRSLRVKQTPEQRKEARKKRDADRRAAKKLAAAKEAA